jgi:hypothetical protein
VPARKRALRGDIRLHCFSTAHTLAQALFGNIIRHCLAAQTLRRLCLRAATTATSMCFAACAWPHHTARLLCNPAASLNCAAVSLEPLAQAVFEGGDYCHKHPARSLRVKLECGGDERAWDASEPSTCAYLVHASTPAACKAERLQELQVGSAAHMSRLGMHVLHASRRFYPLSSGIACRLSIISCGVSLAAGQRMCCGTRSPNWQGWNSASHAPFCCAHHVGSESLLIDKVSIPPSRGG